VPLQCTSLLICQTTAFCIRFQWSDSNRSHVTLNIVYLKLVRLNHGLI